MSNEVMNVDAAVEKYAASPMATAYLEYVAQLKMPITAGQLQVAQDLATIYEDAPYDGRFDISRLTS